MAASVPSLLVRCLSTLLNVTSTIWTAHRPRSWRQQKSRPSSEPRGPERCVIRRKEMIIKLTSVYVDNHDKALHFYTEVLGFTKKADFSNGPYRWLTVASPEEPEGTELQLALNNNPAAQAYQQAMFQQHQPAANFFTDDIKTECERIKARGAEFTMPPTDVTGSTIAMLNDTCGNLIPTHPFEASVMSDRAQYTPGPANLARV